MGKLNRWTKRGLNILSRALARFSFERARLQPLAAASDGRRSFRIFDHGGIKNVPRGIYSAIRKYPRRVETSSRNLN
jgi:hypothetical protein